METLIGKNRYDNDSIGDSKKEFPYEHEILEEASNNYTSETDLKILKN